MTQTLSDEQILLNVGAQSFAPANDLEPQSSIVEKNEWSLPGFSGKSKVLTSFGHLPIEALRRNDPLKTSSGAYLKVSWIDSVQLDREFLLSNPNAQPILVSKGSIAPSKPTANMLVSPAQIIETSGRAGDFSFDRSQKLIGRRNISKTPQTTFTYFLFGCETACSVCVDGIWCNISPSPH